LVPDVRWLPILSQLPRRLAIEATIKL